MTLHTARPSSPLCRTDRDQPESSESAAGTERSVLSAGAEYSRRPINKTQRRKAKQRASPHFSPLALTFLTSLPRWSHRPRETSGERPHCRTVSSRLTKPRRTMRVSTLLPPLAVTAAGCGVTGICRSCFAAVVAAATEKALLTRSR